MSPADIQLWLQLGLGGLMLMALFLGARRVWVFGWIYQEKADECEAWKSMALRSVNAVEKSVTATETLIKKNGST